MTTEKSEGVYPSPKKTKFEQLRADHELFLQAFESESLVLILLRDSIEMNTPYSFVV